MLNLESTALKHAKDDPNDNGLTYENQGRLYDGHGQQGNLPSRQMQLIKVRQKKLVRYLCIEVILHDTVK